MDFGDIGICFFYPRMKGEPYSACDVGRFQKQPGVWYEFIIKFKIKDKNNIVEYTSGKAHDNTPDKEWIWENQIFKKTLLDGLRERRICGIGFCTREGVTAEWRHLRLLEAE